MIANRFTRSCLHTRSPSRWSGIIERPAGPKRRIKPIDKTETEPLEPRPGDHRPVVRAQLRGWREKAKSRALGKRG
jgi:hypothetical protein